MLNFGNAGRIKNKVTIPTRCWKIVVVLPEGENDLKRINNKTRIIAVDMPNDEAVSSRWRSYLTTVDDIEKQTGYNFLSSVPKRIQSVIEAAKDNESDTAESKTEKAAIENTDSGNRRYWRGERGGCYYLTASGNKSYVDKKYCTNIGVSPSVQPSPDGKTNFEPNKPAVKTPQKKTDSSDREHIKGPRGGCYYINSSGKKTYVKKELCGQ